MWNVGSATLDRFTLDSLQMGGAAGTYTPPGPIQDFLYIPQKGWKLQRRPHEYKILKGDIEGIC